MQLSHNEENNFPLSRFESMLKTNDIFFFDSSEFESIIHHYLENGKVQLGKKAVKMGLSQHPDSVNLKLLKAEILVFEEKLEEADALLHDIYLIEPSNEEIYIQKANILSKLDRHEEAVLLLKQALKFTTNEAEIYSLIGMEYLFAQDFENAKDNFIKCLLEDEENDYSALYNVIYCFDFLDQKDEAIEFLNKYLEKDPFNEVGWHQLGKQYADLEEYEKAISAFDFAIISDEFFLGAYLEKGKALEKMHRYKEAVENYEISFTIDAPTPFANRRIGKCYEKLGLDELALKYYEKTIQLDPMLDKGWLSITNFHLRKKNYVEAMHNIRKALDTDEENIRYWKKYAEINKKILCLGEAAKAYERILELGNYELETWLNRSDALTLLGKYETAIQSLLQGAEFYPRMMDIEIRLAGVYFSLGNNKNGFFYLEKALSHDSNAAKTLKELFPWVYAKQEVQEIINSFPDAQPH